MRKLVFRLKISVSVKQMFRHTWILRASDLDSDISLRFRFGHQRQVNHLCPALKTRMKTITDSQDIDCITRLDTNDN